MAIFKLDNDNFKKIEQTQFSNEGILERQHIQNALKKQIDVIAPDILIISEEFSEWSDSKRRIDLLGIDKDGNIVVIELKRTETGEHMDLQAIRYASMVSTLTFVRAVEIFSKYLISIESELNAEDELLSFIGDNKDNFASDVRIILVSSDFSKELTTSVMWLNERDLDIRCYRLIPYKHNEDILIDVQQIIPLPEAESYQVKVREQKEERREVLRGARDNTKYNFNGEVGLGKRGIVRSVWLKYIKDNQGISYEKLTQDFPSDIRGRLFVEIETALEQQRRDGNGLARYFVEDDELLQIGDKKYTISNQWGKGNIEKFLEYVGRLGYEIEEI
ncbi:hypothetical protein [Candidatus Sulfurimonas baltica]|uniref:DUF91 domain-containing protein n=1 Tax=Candidatus Sulfurimonas baltica TaxID=2740404 RepID=A0A7S7LWP4_9BACT|nr:hypothetical protein [Candidatus Sulfurimonas baltica]QOY52732.1 hypothetical protein HUE88_03340 [Candidatus Sulfurimonas baltica]